jgi:hypothetical protein
MPTTPLILNLTLSVLACGVLLATVVFVAVWQDHSEGEEDDGEGGGDWRRRNTGPSIPGPPHPSGGGVRLAVRGPNMTLADYPFFDVYATASRSARWAMSTSRSAAGRRPVRRSKAGATTSK